MNVPGLNEIAAQARQASPSQVSAQVSGQAQLKALKGNSVPDPAAPAPPPVETPPEQTQGPVTPQISSVARAASAYSETVVDGLNSDELNAVQNLADKVRAAVSDFLNQPNLDLTEDAPTVVAENPQAVQNLELNLEQAVVETLSIPEADDAVVVNAALPEAVPEEDAASEVSVSLERITQGAVPNPEVNPIAASPALRNAQANNAAVENPVNGEVAPATTNEDFTVVAASPALQNAQAHNAAVENPVDVEETPVTSSGDFIGIAANPTLAISPADENTSVENPVNTTGQQLESNQSPEQVRGNGQNASSQGPSAQPQSVSPESAIGSLDQGPGAAGSAQNISPEVAPASAAGVNGETATVPSNPQPASGSQPVPDHSASESQPEPVLPSNVFKSFTSEQETPAVNSANVRNPNELVNSVVESEFTSEAKKIFSEPKVIRTIADLADFILERLQEIIAAKQLQKQAQASGETGLS